MLGSPTKQTQMWKCFSVVVKLIHWKLHKDDKHERPAQSILSTGALSIASISYDWIRYRFLFWLPLSSAPKFPAWFKINNFSVLFKRHKWFMSFTFAFISFDVVQPRKTFEQRMFPFLSFSLLTSSSSSDVMIMDFLPFRRPIRFCSKIKWLWNDRKFVIRPHKKTFRERTSVVRSRKQRRKRSRRRQSELHKLIKRTDEKKIRSFMVSFVTHLIIIPIHPHLIFIHKRDFQKNLWRAEKNPLSRRIINVINGELRDTLASNWKAWRVMPTKGEIFFIRSVKAQRQIIFN